MIGIIKKVLMRILRYRQKIKRSVYRYSSIIMANLKEGHYVVGNDVAFEVPVNVIGRGRVIIGDNVGLGYPLAIKLGKGDILLQARRKNAKLLIGKNTYLSNNVSIIACESVEIGEDCLIGDGVIIYDSDFHDINPETRHSGRGLCGAVKVGNNVFIGSRAVIQKGVSIGDNSVIANSSVVVSSIPENVVAGGNPAKIIKNI